MTNHRTSISRASQKTPFPAALAISLVLLSGCVTTKGNPDAVSYDPLEPMNRKVHSFNMAVDKVALRPLAKGYKAVVPSPVRKGVTNFFSNLTTPRSALNNFLQGKPKRGLSELGRFLFNSTLGLGGFFDIAGAGGIERYDENFAETLSAWGVPDGPYIVMPLWGPNMASDLFALPVDYYSDLWTYYDNTSVRSKVWGLRIVELRYRLLSVDSFINDSPDPYTTVRESYMQNRTFRIYDGDLPEEESYEDELFDEFFEDK